MLSSNVYPIRIAGIGYRLVLHRDGTASLHRHYWRKAFRKPAAEARKALWNLAAADCLFRDTYADQGSWS